MVDARITVEVVHAAVDRQLLFSIEVSAGSTVQQVLLLNQVTNAFPGLNLSECPVGIFGRVVPDTAQRVLVDGERIEIYRPLLADPKEVRRLRAAKAAKARQGNE